MTSPDTTRPGQLKTPRPRTPSPSDTQTLLRLFQANAFADMERTSRALTEAYPGSALAWKALGLALVSLERLADALPPLGTSIALHPNDAEVHAYLARAHRGLGNVGQAEAAYRRALTIRPQWHALRDDLASMLFAAQRYTEAADEFCQWSEDCPDAVQAHAKLGVALRFLGRFDDAERSLRRALSLDPNHVDTLYNLGNLLRETLRFGEAEAPHRQAIALDPRYTLAMNNLAETLVELGRFDEGLELYRAAIAVRPDYAGAHWNRSLLNLRLGNFAEGWREYEWRWRYDKFPTRPRDLPRPLWLGDAPIDGRTIAVHWEQGLGDTIQFCRYVAMLADRGARVLFAPPGSLRGLMRGLSGNAELIGLADLANDQLRYDCQVPLMSLPLAFGTDADSIPDVVPYLRADSARAALWRERLGDAGFRIGICWQGSTGPIDQGRSFPVAHLAGIARLPGVRLICLHKGEGLVQLANLPAGMHVETLGEAFDAGPDAFVDTAAVMASCDLVISSDTAVAHLSGALGIPTWVALRLTPDWRWQLGRDDSPWYPTMRLFRQTTRGDWQAVFDRMETAVRKLL